MHTKTMEGLIGARTNMNMTNVPMRVFKEARRKGDLAAMERAMGYVNDFENKAYQYKDEADEGMKEEAKEAREEEKLAREQAIEKRREERKELETQREQTEVGNVEISSEGRSLLNQASSDISANKPDEPVFYTSSGAVDRSTPNEIPTLNVSV